LRKFPIHFLALIFVVPAAHALPAQTDSCLDRTIPVNVMTEQGQPVPGLSAANFTASVHGKPVQVKSANYDTSPRRIVIAVDVSGTMLSSSAGPPGGRTLNIGLLVARNLINAAPPDEQFALLAFSDRVEDKVGFDAGKTTVLMKLEKLRDLTPEEAKGHRTAIWDSLGEGLSMITPTNSGDAVYVITDGGDNASKRTASELRQMFLSSGTRLFGLYIVDPVPAKGRAPELDLHAIVDLANATGGEPNRFDFGHLLRGDFVNVSPDSRQSFRLGSEGLLSYINGFYRLDVRLPEALDKPGNWKIEVLDESGRRAKRLQVIYPRQLAPCETNGREKPSDGSQG
jgi:hypothetical protein